MVIDRSTPGGHDVRHYAVVPGSILTDTFEPVEGQLHLEVVGPNGFYREYQIRTPQMLVVTCTDAPSGDVLLEVRNMTTRIMRVLISSGTKVETIEVGSGEAHQYRRSTEATMGWYDLLVHTAGRARYTARFAGRVETGRMSQSDPAMA
jgi:phospholipase C